MQNELMLGTVSGKQASDLFWSRTQAVFGDCCVHCEDTNSKNVLECFAWTAHYNDSTHVQQVGAADAFYPLQQQYCVFHH